MPSPDMPETSSFLNSLANAPSLSVSTRPANGDQNPYGVTVVPHGFPAGGRIAPGDALVSNFNNAQNLQGTGRTIVAITPAGTVRTFFDAPESLGPVGLTTALLALQAGIVVVGNTPTTDGTSATVMNGSLLFLDRSGNVLLNLSDSALLRGPWDATFEQSNPRAPTLYVSNVLDGTVTRIHMHLEAQATGPVPVIDSLTRVASGFAHTTSAVALVIGPTGLVLNPQLTGLFVADTGNNRVQFVPNVRNATSSQGPGSTVVAGPPLRGPLGMAPSPVGTLVTVNGDAVGSTATLQNLAVEFQPRVGRFVATRQLDPGAPGALFGIAIKPFGGRESLLYVDDNSNTFNVLPRRTW